MGPIERVLGLPSGTDTYTVGQHYRRLQELTRELVGFYLQGFTVYPEHILVDDALYQRAVAEVYTRYYPNVTIVPVDLDMVRRLEGSKVSLARLVEFAIAQAPQD